MNRFITKFPKDYRLIDVSLRCFIFTSAILISTVTGCSDPTQIEADSGIDASQDSAIDTNTSDLVLDPTTSAETLVVANNWSLAVEADDPFSDRIADVDCPEPDGFGVEDLGGEQVFAIDMLFCNYATAIQPLPVDLQPGDVISFRIWHFELTGTTDAHVALRIGDTVLLDKQLSQPQSAALLTDDVVIDKKIDAGTNVFFHVHNHGANEYSIVDIVRK